MKKIFLLIALVTLATASCVKMPKSGPDTPEPESGLKIPDNFDWKTTKEIKVTVGVTAVNPQSKDKLHIIKIYNSPLLNSGGLIATGAATPGKPFDVTLSVASITDTLYLYELKPNGLATVTSQKVSSPSLNVKLSNNLEELPTKSNSFVTSNVMNPAPNVTIPTNYDVTISTNSAIDLLGFGGGQSSTYGNTYKSFIIPQGFTRTADIGFNNWNSHSVLYVKGTLTINKDISLDKCSIVILDGGTVNVKNLGNGGGYTWPMPFLYVQSSGNLNLSVGVNFGGVTVVNKGTITAVKDISTNTTTTIYNEGTISITNTGKNDKLSITNNSIIYTSGTINVANFDLTTNSVLTNDAGVITTKNIYLTNGTIINNHGEIVSTVKFSNSGGGTVNNFCRIIAEETDAQALTANLKEGSLWHTQKLFANNSTFNMDGGSMFFTGNIGGNPYKMKFISTSSSTFALLKNTGNVPDLRSGSFSEISGNIEFVHTNLTTGSGANGNLLYQSSLSNGAILSKEQTKNIPGTTCNQSLGQIDPGTPPEDPNQEFASYFPSQSGWGTYAFEDQWPSKGDYDLNDLVLTFRVTFITNSSNQITKLHFDYNLAAAGAINQIGTGFQLNNVMAANIKSVTGQILGGGTPFIVASNGAEDGATKAIIPIFNNTKEVVSYSGFLNTVPGEHTATADKRITIEFNTPVNQADITMNSFNFFIVVGPRGKEIHLPGYLATEKFNASLATGGSLSPGDNFKNSDGMMWGLMFPESFSYPSEKKSIIDAYTHFAAWATSGGAQYPDWYSNKSGYRNQEHIY